MRELLRPGEPARIMTILGCLFIGTGRSLADLLGLGRSCLLFIDLLAGASTL